MKNIDLSAVSQKHLLAAALRTATDTGVGQDISALEGNLIATLSASAATAGTNPTLDVTLEECDTLNGSYSAISGAAFTRVTTSDSLEKIVVPKTGRKKYVRAVGTHGGTNTPTFPYSVVLEGMPKYS